MKRVISVVAIALAGMFCAAHAKSILLASNTMTAGGQYGEPTIVAASNLTAATGNNMSYSFTESGIQVSCNMGAIVRGSSTSADYFGCNAGNSITFTASQPIKGIVVDGYVKKGYTATVSSGTVVYADASEDLVEANPVLIVTDINSTSVTLNNVKQIRFYNVEFYFAANPDAEIGGDDGDLYSYEYEPTTVSNFDLVMDELEVVDMTDNLGYKAVYMSFANDEAQLDLTAFVDYDATTGIVPGTYPIDFTYAEGTVEASVGGDDYLDYGTYLMTNFEEYEGDWYYDPYYIVSGTLTVTTESVTLTGLSYYGSTIRMTYYFDTTGLREATQVEKDKAVKYLRNGRIVIRKGGREYGVMGN